MSASRPGRLTPADAERLLTGEPTERGEGVRALLEAATAAASPAERAGEAAAVSAYRAAFDETVTVHGTEAAPVARLRRTRGRTRRGRTAVRIAALGATFAAVLVAGTSFAAGSGRLPDGPQQQAHRIFGFAGVPAPILSAPSATPASLAAPGDTHRPVPSSSAHPSAVPSPTSTGLVGLCLVWRALYPGPISAEIRKALATAAGGVERIEQFCTDLLTPAGAPPSGDPASPAHPDHPSTGPKH